MQFHVRRLFKVQMEILTAVLSSGLERDEKQKSGRESPETAQRIRYDFGTTGGEISGGRACKRRSAKHLESLPSLLEGRRSIQLSYGRLIYSKRFHALTTTTLFRS